MRETIQRIILDFQELKLPYGIKRRRNIESVATKATVCIGVRRSGKSTFLFQMMQRLLEGGTPRENILYLNFFDDRLYGLRHEHLSLVTEAYYSLYPSKKGTEKVYCFFDEIQSVQGWEPFVDRLMRTENCEVFLTGSSATMLSKEIATQMRGRALSWEIFPFSFREFLDSRRIESEGPFSTKRRLLIEKAFREYWETGGFPEIAVQWPHAEEGIIDDGVMPLPMPARLRVKTHQEYFQAILFRDLVERHDVSHPKLVADMAHRLIDNVASVYTLNSLQGYLKSLSHKFTRSVLSDYMQWFEDAYCLFSVRLFDANLARSNMNPKKLYCIDHSLVSSVSSGILVNSGHLLENLVFTAIRREYQEIFYYRTGTGKEVDFIVSPRGKARSLIQVCETLADPQTRKREVTALEEAMKELKLKAGIIVTRNEEEGVATESGAIRILPAWRFLLEVEAMGDSD